MRDGNRFTGVILAALLVAGCGPIIDLPGGGEPAPLYELRALDGAATVGASGIEWTIFIEEPSAPNSLRSDRLAVRPGNARIEYIADARWSDQLPRMIGRYVVESLENAGVRNVIGQEHIELRGDYRLKLDIRDFSATASAGGRIQQVEVRLSVLMVRAAPAEIIARQQFTATVDVNGDSVAAIVEAFNSAIDDTMSRMIGWLQDLPAP